MSKTTTRSRQKLFFAGLAALVCSAILLAGCGGSQPALAGTWERLSVSPEGGSPGHEVLSCSDEDGWSCTYSLEAEPDLGFDLPDATTGNFSGEQITDGWTCPEWFEQSICDSEVFVVGGVMEFSPLDGDPFTVDEELIVTESGDIQMLYVYWVDWFVCPWYRTFDQALEANPFPTPFNGDDGPVFDCVFAPESLE
ncbi:MAG: hypothetical protein ACK2TT_08265 [Anaerolineales bacterium]